MRQELRLTGVGRDSAIGGTGTACGARVLTAAVLRATGRRTMFMLFTGPVMVLAVLLAAWLGWRAWQRRQPS